MPYADAKYPGRSNLFFRLVDVPDGDGGVDMICRDGWIGAGKDFSVHLHYDARRLTVEIYSKEHEDLPAIATVTASAELAKEMRRFW
jgi:hypothetical protein